MENRKKLHDCGLALTIIGILNLFMFGTTIVSEIIDGSAAATFATVDANIVGAVRVVLGIIAILAMLLVAADVLLGIKALKVSKTPNADKGYITAAKVFLVLSVISTISHINTLIGGNALIVDTVLNVVNAVLNVCIYALFIKAANAVRKDVLGEKLQ